MDKLADELEEKLTTKGAWVEHKEFLVAWHYRAVEKGERQALKDQVSCGIQEQTLRHEDRASDQNDI